ncbi:hypothetical protein I4U23_021299 [Adineta vaga]|nr:hypothetical protein I4U23_021299 [Adineta vaga]
MITVATSKINNQTILQEQFDENYEPTPEEIREYAIYIGIDPDNEPHLLSLAKEGILKPLPPGWKPCQEGNGELYYFNFDTGTSSWDHPCDEIYKQRVIDERHKRSSSNLLDTNPRGTLTQTGGTTSTVTDYLIGGKKPSTLRDNNSTSVVTRNVIETNKIDSHYENSDNEIEELMHSDDDDEEQSSDDFRRKVDFGIDPTLSARIEKDEKAVKEAIATSRPFNSLESTDRKFDTRKSSDDDDDYENQRKLRAVNAERRSSGVSVHKPEINDDSFTTPREEDMTRFRIRLEQAKDEEKLQIFEEHEALIAKYRNELRLEKDKQEKVLREKMKTDLASIENEIHETMGQEKRFLESRKQDEINHIKETIEKEKDEIKKKLRASMQSDLDVFKGTLEQQNNVNAQLRSLQDKLTREKNSFEEKIRHLESQHKNEIADLTRRYEQAKNDREKFEKHLKEKDNLHSTLKRTIEQITADKASIERKLQDAESQLKAIDNSHRQIQFSNARQSLITTSDNESDDDDDDGNNSKNLKLDQSSTKHHNGFHHDEDDIDRLSDTDSDVIEMEQTLKELRQTQLEYMSLLPITNLDGKQHSHMKPNTTATVDFSKLSVADVGPVIRNIRTMQRTIPRLYESLEATSNHQLLNDSGRWSNSLISTTGNNTNSLSMYQTLNSYQSTLSKTNHWTSQPNLVTREAVLKAARRVFSPAIIDQLTTNTRSSTH